MDNVGKTNRIHDHLSTFRIIRISFFSPPLLPRRKAINQTMCTKRSLWKGVRLDPGGNLERDANLRDFLILPKQFLFSRFYIPLCRSLLSYASSRLYVFVCVWERGGNPHLGEQTAKISARFFAIGGIFAPRPRSGAVSPYVSIKFSRLRNFVYGVDTLLVYGMSLHRVYSKKR